jgi:hypothetical protein
MYYPRPGEPIVPRLLRPLVLERRPSPFPVDPDTALLAREDLSARAWTRLPAETCRRISLLVVDRVQTRLRPLPEAIRDAPLPAPDAALALPIERRTANTLRRALGPRPDGETWTVGRYLKIRRFGGRALVDLLAAVEGDAGRLIPRPVRSGPDADRGLHDALLTIARQLPIAEDQLQDQLKAPLDLGQRGSHRDGPLDVTQLLRSAAQLGHELSFRVIALAGTRVVVRLSDLSAAHATYRIAVRAVRILGAATVDGIAMQVRATTRGPIDAAFTARLLSSLPAFRWLDREGGWFWFEQRSNPLVANVRKVLSVVTRLPIARLAAVLFRARGGPRPSRVFVQGLCRAVPEAHVANGMVTVDKPLDRRANLDERESRLVRFLEAAGRGLSDVQLRWLVREIGLAWTPIWRLLRNSPLFEQSPDGLFRLVGSN